MVSSSKIAIPLIIIPLVFLFLTALQLLNSGCIHASDFAIYQQAIYDIAAGLSFNPYLTIRNLHIFNDHFDPILILAAPFARIFNYSNWSLLVFELLWFLAVLSFAWIKSSQVRLSARISLMVCILFSKGLLSGLTFPIHPSTWAMLPTFLIAYFLCVKNRQGLFWSAVALCLFRESFPFAVITLGLSLVLLWRDWRKVGVALFGVGLVFQLFNYILRPMLLGDIMDYGGHVLNESTLNMILTNDYLPLVKILYPFIPVIFLIFYKRSFKNLVQDPIVHVFAFLAPLAAIHIITGKFHFQYGAQFAAPLLVVIGFHPKVNIGTVSKRVMIATALLSIVSGMSIYTKSFNSLVLSKSNKCEISEENKANLESLKSFFDENIQATDRVLVTGGLAPILMRPNRKIYQAGMFSEKLPYYEYAFISRVNKTDTYPFNYELNEKFKECEIVFSNSSLVGYKNVGVECLPDIFMPTEQE